MSPLCITPLSNANSQRGVACTKKDMYIDTLVLNYMGDCMGAHSLALVAHKKNKGGLPLPSMCHVAPKVVPIALW